MRWRSGFRVRCASLRGRRSSHSDAAHFALSLRTRSRLRWLRRTDSISGRENVMRSRMWLVGAVASICTIVVLGQQPEPPAQPSGAYVARCATCHGPTMGGASAPPILSYIRYHTDADTIARVRETHKTLQIADDELRQVLADMRIMAGTNPAMATGGFT